MILDFDKLDKVIHERGRLGIMTLLATRVRWPFSDLKSELKMSDGNLVTPSADAARLRLRGRHQRGLEPASNHLRADRTRTPCFPGLPHPARTNRQNGPGLIQVCPETLRGKANLSLQLCQPKHP